MDLDAAALHSPEQPERADPAERVIFIARRALGWLADSFLLGIALTLAWSMLSLVAMLFVGATIGVAGGGLEGLAAGGVAGIFAIVLLLVAIHVIAVATLLGYYAWAARRSGEGAGQTLGHQLVGVRVVVAAEPQRPIRGRHLLGRELARYLWLCGLAVPALMLTATTGRAGLGNLLLFGGIAAVIWWSSADRFPHDRLAGTRVIEADAKRS